MKHAPATIKGMNRRRIIHAIENGIRVIIMMVSLYIFCTFSIFLCDWATRMFVITGVN